MLVPRQTVALERYGGEELQRVQQLLVVLHVRVPEVSGQSPGGGQRRGD